MTTLETSLKLCKTCEEAIPIQTELLQLKLGSEHAPDVLKVMLKEAEEARIAALENDPDFVEVDPGPEAREAKKVPKAGHSLPLRPKRLKDSVLKGTKKDQYTGGAHSQRLLDLAGIQPDGTIDRRKKKSVKGAHVVATNGDGTFHIGETSKVVETAAYKKDRLREWINRPVLTSLVTLSVVMGKTMQKHFFYNALQTVHIFRNVQSWKAVKL